MAEPEAMDRPYRPDEDPELFCPSCRAGTESAEHHETCEAERVDRAANDAELERARHHGDCAAAVELLAKSLRERVAERDRAILDAASIRTELGAIKGELRIEESNVEHVERERDEARSALEEARSGIAGLLVTLSEELAWLKNERDPDQAALGRIVGFEDAVRTVRQALASSGRPAAQEAGEPPATVGGKIRAILNGYDIAAAGQIDHLTGAIRAVLGMERTDRGFVRADDPETTRWMMGYDEALDEVQKIIAAELGIPDVPSGGPEPWPGSAETAMKPIDAPGGDPE